MAIPSSPNKIIPVKKFLASAFIRGSSYAPPAILRLLAGGTREAEGRILDPEIQMMIRASGLFGGLKFYERPPLEARRFYREQMALIEPKPLAMSSVQDLQIPTAQGFLKARLYIPFQSGFPMPALVYFHGGGFFVGDLDTHDDVCRFLALHASCAVVSVAYRLAPEAPAPAPIEDGLAAFRWLHREAASLKLRSDALAIGGDSAGGNLSAVVSQLTRKDEVKPVFQLLIYPPLDFSQRRPSCERFKEGYLLDDEMLGVFRKHYLSGGIAVDDLRISPLLAPDLEGLPPAYLALSGFDPLLDEGIAYGERLRHAGIKTTVRCFDSLPHGFVSFTRVSKAAYNALFEIATALRQALRT